MDVVVDELETVVEVAGEGALLDPAVLRRVAHAVAAALAGEETQRRFEAGQRDPAGTRRGQPW